MKALFLEAAEMEFLESITFYNIQQKGLGYEFADEVYSAIERITDNPEAWTPLSKKTRRCQTKRFPYGIIYQSENSLRIFMYTLRHYLKIYSSEKKVKFGNIRCW